MIATGNDNGPVNAMSEILRTTHIALAAVLISGAMPIAASELACNVFGTQYAEWQGAEYRLSQSKEYHEAHRFRLITGDKPRIAFMDKDTNTWAWADLAVVDGVQGAMYSGVLQDGGKLTAALNDDETRIVLNYMRIESSDGNETVISSATGIGDCAKH